VPREPQMTAVTTGSDLELTVDRTRTSIQDLTPKVAIVHDWLTGMRGGERVLESICRLLPDAEIVTLLHVRGSVSPLIEHRRVRTSIVQHLPDVARRYRQYQPIFPTAIELLDFDDVDLVVSTS